jgi:hypothetical protein
MTEACQHLHDVLSRLPRFTREDLAQIPKNGLYILFEKGEEAHGGERIVRVGTHRGQNNLPARIREHLYIYAQQGPQHLPQARWPVPALQGWRSLSGAMGT